MFITTVGAIPVRYVLAAVYIINLWRPTLVDSPDYISAPFGIGKPIFRERLEWDDVEVCVLTSYGPDTQTIRLSKQLRRHNNVAQ